MHRLIALLAIVVAACSEDPGDILDATDVFTGEEHACFDCDDRDFCTDDFCQNDTCVHVPRNAFNACQSESHCDDGNACTIDTCLVDECNLKRCASAWVGPDCVACDFGFCDDGNPCTTDTCGEDKICTFTTPAEGCDARCTASMATTASSAAWNPYGSYIGYARARVVCEGDACVCDNPLTLADEYGALDLESADSESPWSCSVDVCEATTPTCEPLAHNVAYVVWGEAVFFSRFAVPARADTAASPDGGAAVDTFMPDADVGQPPPIDHVVVQGYCLSPRLDHVAGRYAASFESDGATSTASAVISGSPVRNEVLVVSFSDCANCTATGFVEQSAPLGAIPDVVSFPLRVGSESGVANLYGQAGAFVGSVTTAEGKFLGRLTLERLPPE